jgi:hypothetical protein
MITFYRGDQYTRRFTIKDRATGQPVNINGYTFLLTVNSKLKPEDDADEIFQITGVVQGDGSDGQVAFAFTSTHTNIPPKKYYYDIQMTSGGGDIRTIVKSNYIIQMDITK